jgi:hypothetical protein
MKLVINGADVELDGRYAKTPLPWVLRDVAGLHGARFGCGAGFCAARTVLIDGRKHDVLPDRDRAGGGQGNHSRGGLQPGCRRRPHSQAVSAGSKPCDTSSEKVDPLRRRIDSGTGVSGALTMPATSLQAASEEVVKRDPGLTRAHRSSRTSLIPHIAHPECIAGYLGEPSCPSPSTPRSPRPYTPSPPRWPTARPRWPGTPPPGRQRTVGSLPLPSSADVGL